MLIKSTLVRLTVFFCGVSVAASYALNNDAESSQASAKSKLEAQILAEVESQLKVDQSQVTVHLLDRRLVVPSCDKNFSVSFPFSDRRTARVSCDSLQWTKYIRVSFGPNRSIMVYRRGMAKGDIVHRGDVKFINSMSNKHDMGELVKSIDEVIDRALQKNVDIDAPVRLDDFSTVQKQVANESQLAKSQVLVALTTINRGTRLNSSLFKIEMRQGRLPTDTIAEPTDLKFLQANRLITSGDILRRSTVIIAPAVKKGDLVKILIQRGALSVSATVQALSDGSIGDVIEVVNLDSNRPLRAKVIDVGSLEII